MSRAVIISTTWVCAVWFTVVGVGYAIAGDWALVAPYLCAATGWVSAAVAKTRLEHGLDCASHDPISGAVCQKPEGHMGGHGGMTKDGTWRNWP